MSKETPSKHPQPFFSLDDVDEILKRNQTRSTSGDKPSEKKALAGAKPDTKKALAAEPKPSGQRLGAVSAADILGFSLNEPDPLPKKIEDERVPKKFLSFYRQLVELREHVVSGLAFHTQETLNRSSKDDSGDLSGYSQHMADAGTETFDRDFALSLVSSEKEALHEIDKAIERILNGTYGVCMITGKPIAKERLKAVPFARFSVEGQMEFERTQKRTVQRGGAFAETVEESAAFSGEDDGED
jgi:RNA polymerase-binding transcription factor DksA